MRCPNCGSSAQLKVVSTEYHEDGWEIEVVRHYVCGCGERCVGKSYYHCEGWEIAEAEDPCFGCPYDVCGIGSEMCNVAIGDYCQAGKTYIKE